MTKEEKEARRMKIELIHGDCLEEMKNIEDNSIDLVLTDPPYGLEFMGKDWDKGVPGVHFWVEMLRVLKPGGYLLSFSGTRTYHRMGTAIEDAGFEVRDMIEWVYGSGFPKSLNIGKAVDKLQGNEKFREKEIEFVKWLKSNLDCYWCSGLGVISDNEEGFGDPSSCLDCGGKGKYTMEDVDEWLGTKAQAFHFFAESDSNRQIPNTETYTILKSRLHLDDRYDDFVKKHSLLLEEIREVQGYEKSIKNWDKKYNKAILNKPKTELASEWEGWGTALKPAHEPICIARKPLAEKTVAENALKYGTGGINIDGSRVSANWKEERPESWFNSGKSKSGNPTYDGNLKSLTETTVGERLHDSGRFPANLIHDGSDEVKECFPNESERFFKSIIYQAKASKSERNRGCEELEEKAITQAKGNGLGRVCNVCAASQLKPCECENNTWVLPIKNKNNHPTVKPVALMEYLAQMCSTEGAVVLDPFMGSGTTGVACKKLNRNFIGIELDKEYFEIAKKRIG